MIEIIAEKWELQGWHETASGNWYHPNVCKGLSAHIPKYCDECGHLYLQRKYKTKGAKGGKGRFFCSRSCSRKVASKDQDISHLKAFERKSGERPHNFIGNTSHSHGYRVVSGNGKRSLEHRAVVEIHLGRFLNGEEVVHHRNHDRTDNRIENLQVMTRREHLFEHWKDGSFDHRNVRGEW